MITHSRILKVTAEKMKEGAAESMNVSVNITDVSFKGSSVTVAYWYEIDYAPAFAKMEVRGDLTADEKPANAKEIEETFKKTKRLPPAFAEEILTAISYTATTVGTLLAFAIGVTAPLNVPRARLAPPGAASTKAG